MSTPRIRLPSSAHAGETVEIRTLLDHPMETGLRQGDGGRVLPRDMLKRFEVLANGEVVFAADFANGTAANPTLSFFLKVERTTMLTFVWEREAGPPIRAEGTIRVA